MNILCKVNIEININVKLPWLCSMRMPRNSNTTIVTSTPSTQTPPSTKRNPGSLEIWPIIKVSHRKMSLGHPVVVQIDKGNLTSNDRHNEKNTESVTFWPKIHKLNLIMQTHWTNQN